MSENEYPDFVGVIVETIGDEDLGWMYWVEYSDGTRKLIPEEELIEYKPDSNNYFTKE